MKTKNIISALAIGTTLLSKGTIASADAGVSDGHGNFCAVAERLMQSGASEALNAHLRTRPSAVPDCSPAVYRYWSNLPEGANSGARTQPRSASAGPASRSVTIKVMPFCKAAERLMQSGNYPALNSLLRSRPSAVPNCSPAVYRYWSNLPEGANSGYPAPARGGSPGTAARAVGTMPTPGDHSRIRLVREGGTFKVPVNINGVLELHFVVDSGAADVSIPADVVRTLLRTGTIKRTDFTGTRKYRLADGAVVESRTFIIRSLKVGQVTITNVQARVADIDGSLLLGQTFLSRFKRVSFDYANGVLVLE